MHADNIHMSMRVPMRTNTYVRPWELLFCSACAQFLNISGKKAIKWPLNSRFSRGNTSIAMPPFKNKHLQIFGQNASTFLRVHVAEFPFFVCHTMR